MEMTLRQRAIWTPPRSILVYALLFLVLAFAFPLFSSLAEEPASAPIDPIAQTELTLLERINAVRAEHGLHPLVLNERLSDAAHGHVADMHGRNRWGHGGSDGSGYYERVARTGYIAEKVNEAVGYGYNMDRMINWWLNSPVHRGILLSPSYTEIGIGYLGNPDSQWGHWWVVNVAVHK